MSFHDRDYQTEVASKVLSGFQDEPGSSTLVVAATGLGKTIIFSRVIQGRLVGGKRKLVIAHREELVRQAADKIRAIAGCGVEIEMAENRADLNPMFQAEVIVASKDTLAHRLKRYNPADFDTIVTDEAHHAVAGRYRAIYDHFQGTNPAICHLGVTATPDRADEEALAQVYDSVAANLDIQYGIEHGWLVPVKQRIVHVDDLDLDNVSTVSGDFNQKELVEELEHHGPLHQMAGPLVEIANTRRSLVFCASVHQAEVFASVLNEYDKDKAVAISGGTPKEARRELLKRYRAGDLRYLVNVGVFTEGFDDPGVEVVAMARPTKSRMLYAQMVGRGTRVLPEADVDGAFDREERVARIASSQKSCVEVLDFTGRNSKHKLVTSFDILGGRYSEEAIERAKQSAGKSGKSVAEALEQAQGELDQERAANDALLRAKKRVAARFRAKWRATDVDPFNEFDAVPERQQGISIVAQCTQKQAAMLKRHGYDTQGMSKRRASQLIGAIIAKGRQNR